MTGHTRQMKFGLWCAALAVLALGSCTSENPSPVEPTSPGVEEALMPSANAAAPLSFYQVSSGEDWRHTCGLTTENRAYCWGTGYLGDGPDRTYLHTTPVAVSGGYRFRQISAGAYFTCAVTTDYRAYCWGDGVVQNGDGTAQDRATPVPVAPNLRFLHVSSGAFHTCGLTLANRVYCWGWNGEGRLGKPGAASTNDPVEIAGSRRYNQVSAGFKHSCAVTTTKQIYCWGANESGRLGNNSTVAFSATPVRVAGARGYKQVDVGFYHSCAVTDTDRAYCWGRGSEGQVGDGKTLNRWEPRLVAGTSTFARVSVGGRHSCGETRTNQVYCWGNNLFGELGDGTNTQRLTPVAVAGGRFFSQLSVGHFYSCAVSAADGAGYCWGKNEYAPLGDGTRIDRTTPSPVAGPS